MQKSRMNTRTLAIVCRAFMRSRSPQGCKFSPASAQDSSAAATAAKPQTVEQGGLLRRFPRTHPPRAMDMPSCGTGARARGRSKSRASHPASDSVVPEQIGYVIPVLAETGKELRRPRRAVPDRELPRLHDRGAGGEVCLY